MASEKDDAKTKSSRKSLRFLHPAPPDAHPNLQRASSRYITVEPMIAVVCVGVAVLIAVLPQYLRVRVAVRQNVTLPDDDGGINGSCVARNTSNPYYVQLQEVQAEVAYWQMIHDLCGYLPALFIAPFLGAWSDVIGRKIVLGIGCVGTTCYMAGFVLTYQLTLPIWVIPVFNLCIGFTGGVGLFISQGLAYISDVTSKENRLLRMAVIQAVALIMIGTGQVAIGLLIRDFGFGPPLYMALVAFFAGFLYVVIPGCLIETVDRKEKHIKSTLADGYKKQKDLFNNNANLRRWRLILLFIIDFLRELTERSSPIVVLYGLGPPFCWTSVEVSGYYTIILVAGAVCALVATKGLSIFLPDLWNLQVSMVFNMIYGFSHAFASSTIGLYIAGLVGCLRSISQVLLPAMLAKTVSSDENGAVFAFDASVQNLGSLLSPLILNSVYRLTVQTQPNFVFIVMSIIGAIPFIFTIILQVVTRYSKQMEQRAVGATEKEGLETNGTVAMADMATVTE